MSAPKITPRTGLAPYAPSSSAPEMSTTPISVSGRAARIRRPGASLSTNQAANGTITTWRLPSTVASPAPTSAIAWCQKTRSAAKNSPAIHASRRWPGSRGP